MRTTDGSVLIGTVRMASPERLWLFSDAGAWMVRRAAVVSVELL